MPLDRWTVSPGVSFEYGGRYARYDYLAQPGLFSPRAGLTLEPTDKTRDHRRAGAAHDCARERKSFSPRRSPGRGFRPSAPSRRLLGNRPARRARTIPRRSPRARSQQHVRDRRAPVLPGRRQSGDHHLRDAIAVGHAIGRALLRRDRRVSATPRAGGVRLSSSSIEARQRIG